MKVRVLAFATAADALGAREIDVELPAGSRLADLRRELAAAHPSVEDLWSRLAVAVDGHLAGVETPLADGAEVALLPPVSGGRGPVAELVDGPIDVDALLAETTDAGRGAQLVFLGRVRDHHQGRPVGKLTYDAYRSMAVDALRRIVAELERDEPGLRVGIVHRLGEVGVGEASVAIVASSPHRAAAYDASRRALERLKREVPIWKREHYLDGDAVWREEEALVSGAGSSPTGSPTDRPG